MPELTYNQAQQLPFPVGHRLMDAIALRQKDQFWTYVRDRNVRHMFFGHLHRPIAGSWRRIPISVCRSTVSQVGLFLDSDDRGTVYENPQYAVALIDSDQVVVHFHDFLYSGPTVTFRSLPPVVGDDESTAYDFQANTWRGRRLVLAV